MSNNLCAHKGLTVPLQMQSGAWFGYAIFAFHRSDRLMCAQQTSAASMRNSLWIRMSLVHHASCRPRRSELPAACSGLGSFLRYFSTTSCLVFHARHAKDQNAPRVALLLLTPSLSVAKPAIS
jgi:hypothetical protein